MISQYRLISQYSNHKLVLLSLVKTTGLPENESPFQNVLKELSIRRRTKLRRLTVHPDLRQNRLTTEWLEPIVVVNRQLSLFVIFIFIINIKYY